MIVSRNTLGQWFGQVTTGGGFVALVKVIGDIVAGAPLATVWPLGLAALVAIVWPENTAAQQAGVALGTDAEKLAIAAGLLQAKTAPENKP